MKRVYTGVASTQQLETLNNVTMHFLGVFDHPDKAEAWVRRTMEGKYPQTEYGRIVAKVDAVPEELVAEVAGGRTL